ncbi:hypothetical protein NPIL_280991 [Nephila pilipes]|uniref:Uncharacterized protein n=1 Tax=Nephila pilipes TaxID=299642 RepID=A0A8X6II53_NEPPI|nr:hypothetical protein NPIL_280991 [Nephila pilipes]
MLLKDPNEQNTLIPTALRNFRVCLLNRDRREKIPRNCGSDTQKFPSYRRFLALRPGCGGVDALSSRSQPDTRTSRRKRRGGKQEGKFAAEIRALIGPRRNKIVPRPAILQTEVAHSSPGPNEGLGRRKGPLRPSRFGLPVSDLWVLIATHALTIGRNSARQSDRPGLPEGRLATLGDHCHSSPAILEPIDDHDKLNYSKTIYNCSTVFF